MNPHDHGYLDSLITRNSIEFLENIANISFSKESDDEKTVKLLELIYDFAAKSIVAACEAGIVNPAVISSN